MKKKRILSVLLTGVLAIGLIGCVNSSSKEDDKTIKIGVTPVPHNEIVEQIKDDVEAKGYKLDIQVINDYLPQDTAVEEGELDANFFQHIAYLNQVNEEKGYHLAVAAEIHVEPMGIYSNTVKKIEDVKDGAKVAIPNDPSNEARALRLLAKAGLITIPEGELVTAADIKENKKNLQFTEVDAAQLPRTLEEVDLAVINGNYALDAGLNVNEDAIYIEDKDDENIKDMRNVLAVKEENLNSEKTKVLVEALTSDKVRKFIEDNYKGAVIPVF